MLGDELHLGAIDQDFMLGCLETQDVGDVLGGDGVMVCFKRDEAVGPADPKGDFGAVIGMARQGLKHFLAKEFQGGTPGCVVDVQIGLLLKPPPGSGPEIIQVLEVSSIEEIPLYVLKRRLDFTLRFRPALSARNGFALIMGDKGGEGGIEDWPPAFPSEHHGLFTIVETFLWHPTVIFEGILMSSDQAVEVMADRKVDVLTSGESQDVRKALHLTLATPGEGDRIGAPIHLSLLPRVRLSRVEDWRASLG